MRPVSSLNPHEETIPSQAEKLADQIRRDTVQKDPLIIDSDSGAVLDGMHRLKAFDILGIENVVCCAVDYSSPSVSLHRWVRVVRVRERRMLQELLAGLGTSEKVGLELAFAESEGRRAVAIITPWECRIMRLKGNEIYSGFAVVKKVEAVARQMNWEEKSVPEDELDVALRAEGSVAILPPRAGKQDVVKAARTGRLFPYKSTMHVVDPRPVGVRFPVSELNGYSRARELLDEKLRRSTPTELPAGSVYEGRRYKERLIILEEM